MPNPLIEKLNRRRFCQGVAAGGMTLLSGSRVVGETSGTSIKTQGTLAPIFEQIVCKWTPENPRHDHQQLFVLDDRRTMLVWSEYYADRPSLLERQPTTLAGQAADEVPCRVSARVSTDRCRTWSDRFTLQENVFKKNVKHASMLRLPNGEVLFFFTGWNSNASRTVYLKRSQDNCETWSEAQQISRPGWFCINHGRILRLKSGRIVLPSHAVAKDGITGAPYTPEGHLHSLVFYSDDDFKTWKESADSMTAPGRGAHEASVVELNDGRLLCILRTTTGRLHRSYSDDGGVHWSKPEPTDFPAPDAEPLVTRVPATGDLLLMWNNVESRSNWPRTPLSMALSPDEGKTWGRYWHIDARPDRDAAYPYVFFQGDEVVVTYYTRPTSWARDCEVMLRIYPLKQFTG